MKRSIPRALLMLVAAAPIAWWACRPARDTGAPAEPGAAAAGDEAAAAGPLGTALWLDDLRLGREVGPEGGVPLAQETNDFAVGEAVYVSMAVSDAPANASVHVVYESAAGEVVAEDAKKVPMGARHLYFDSGDTTSWPAGAYRVVVAIDGERVAALELTLVESPAN